MPMSLVLVTTDGPSHCLLLQQTRWPADVEVVVADGSPGCAPHEGTPPFVHVRRPGAGILALRRAGIAAATHDWVIVSEDHCTQDADLFAAYRAAIARWPDLTLAAGTVGAPPGLSRAAEALFLSVFHTHMGERATPAGATIANALLRRSAMEPRERDTDGGLEWWAMARLAAGPGYRNVPAARVTHVKPLGFLGACKDYWANGLESYAGCPLPRRTRAMSAALLSAELIFRNPGFVARSAAAQGLTRTWVYVPYLVAYGVSFAAGATAAILSTRTPAVANAGR